jgi:hypothetical protein
VTDDHDALRARIRSLLESEMNTMRLELNRQLYADGSGVDIHYKEPTRMVRLWWRVRAYLAGWREAIGCVYRAALGRVVIPADNYWSDY